MPRPRKTPPAPPRPELVALLGACRDQPDDDGPRLVLADWLEDHGEPERAELVRVQCRLARGGAEEDAWLTLHARERELLSQHRERWLAPFNKPGWFAQLQH